MNLYKPKLKSQRDNQLGKSQRDKPKFKPKLFKRLIALTLAMVTALTALPITALADDFVFGGNSNSSNNYKYSNSGTYTYGFNGQYVSWRISLYVSTSDDGTIDPLTDSIVGQNGLGYIGTILYDNFDHNVDVYYQAMYTADTRNATIYDAPDGKSVRAFPYMTKVNFGDDTLQYSDFTENIYDGYGHVVGTNKFTPDGSPIYHNTTDLYTDYGLPYLGSQCTGKVVENVVSTHKFAEQIIEDMNRHLGGSSGNFKPLYLKVFDVGACKIGTEAGNALDEKIEKDGIAAYDLLLPTNENCVVEWCLVVEPISEYRTVDATSFWDCTLYDDFWECWEPTFVGLGVSGTTIGLDAYAVAQYNEKSKVQYTYNNFLTTISKRITNFEPLGHLSGKAKYAEVGKLIAEYGTSNINNAASMNYDCHTECNPYCGVPVAGSAVGFSYSTNPQYTATYGGISVYTTDKDTAQIPVYYYIYDENNNFLRKETDSYTQNETHTFQPSTEYGIPIAMESTSRGDIEKYPADKCFYEFSEYVDFYYNLGKCKFC